MPPPFDRLGTLPFGDSGTPTCLHYTVLDLYLTSNDCFWKILRIFVQSVKEPKRALYKELGGNIFQRAHDVRS